MKLILVDTTSVECFEMTSTWREQCLGILVRREMLCPRDLKRKRDQYLSAEDIARNQLISEILTPDTGPLRITLTMKKEKWAPAVEIALESSTCSPSGCILRKLRNRFQDHVKIFMSLKHAPNKEGGELVEFAKPEGMTIDGNGKNINCFARTTASSNEANFDGESIVQLKIVADIPDSIIYNDDVPSARKILEKGSFSDVTIVAENGAEIKSHKSFLSVCSPVFEAMLRSKMEESKTGRVDMTDLSEEGVKAFLRYVYYGDLTLPQENIGIAFEVLYAAHKYDMRGLEAKMIAVLTGKKNEDFDVGLAFKIFMFVRNIDSFDSAVGLKTKSVQIMKANLDELESLQEYKELFLKSSNANIAMEICRELAKASSV